MGYMHLAPNELHGVTDVLIPRTYDAANVLPFVAGT
jgi:hypothetical protein